MDRILNSFKGHIGQWHHVVGILWSVAIGEDTGCPRPHCRDPSIISPPRNYSLIIQTEAFELDLSQSHLNLAWMFLDREVRAWTILPSKNHPCNQEKWNIWQFGVTLAFIGSLVHRGVCSLTLRKAGSLSLIMKRYWLPPPEGEVPDGKDCSTQGWGNCTFGWKGSYCFLSPGTFSIKEPLLRWSITSLSDKEIIAIRAAPLHITCSSHAVQVEKNQSLSTCSRSSVSTGSQLWIPTFCRLLVFLLHHRLSGTSLKASFRAC